MTIRSKPMKIGLFTQLYNNGTYHFVQEKKKLRRICADSPEHSLFCERKVWMYMKTQTRIQTSRPAEYFSMSIQKWRLCTCDKYQNLMCLFINDFATKLGFYSFLLHSGPISRKPYRWFSYENLKKYQNIIFFKRF